MAALTAAGGLLAKENHPVPPAVAAAASSSDPHAGHAHESGEAGAKPCTDNHEGENAPAGKETKGKATPAPAEHDCSSHAPDGHAPGNVAKDAAEKDACEDTCGDHEEGHVDEVTLTTDSLRQSGVVVEQVRAGDLADEIVVPARISYNMNHVSHVGTPVQGRIVEVLVHLGEKVTTGGALFVIDSPGLGEAQSEYLQKLTDVEVAESGVEIARSALDRAKSLVDTNAIPASEYENSYGDFKKASGLLRVAKAQQGGTRNKLFLLGQGREAIDRLTSSSEINPRFVVVAPISGTVVEREPTLGEVVGTEREALAVLADVSRPWILAEVPEKQIHRVETGATATVIVGALNGQGFPGRVEYIAPVLDSQTRTAQVRIVLEEENLLLKPGMFATARLRIDTPGKAARGVLAVPEEAVQIVEGGPAVFVEADGDPNRFLKQPVKVGEAKGRMVPVLSGLEEGQRIVTAGSFILKAELAKGIMEGKTCSGH